jgi:hypothetical protein
MIYRPGSLLISVFLVAGSGVAQIVLPGQMPPSQFPGQYPGQYPGQSRYPGGTSSPFPGRGRNTTTGNQAALTTIAGTLRRISDSELVLEDDDKRVVTIALASSTKLLTASGANGKIKDFRPGDQLSVDAAQDDNGYYHAKTVTQVKVGTPEERAAASQPVDDSPIGNKTSTDSDDDRPRLHRNPTSDSASTDSASTNDKTNAPATQTASQQTAAAPPPDPADPGPPVLRHGAQPRDTSNLPPLVSQNDSPTPSRPSIHADEVNGVTRTPDAPKTDSGGNGGGNNLEHQSFPSSGDAVIDKARESAFSFSETLPNYVVKQFTTRYQTEAAKGGQTSWHAYDTVTADVVSEGGTESYKNILVNGKPPKEAVEKTGSWSTGEYSSVLLDVLSPSTYADFHNRRSTTIVNRAAYRYDFAVEQANSHWHVYASSEFYKPEYTGAIWIDKENSRVLRIELSARNMPKTFALDTVESAVDYDYVAIGDNKYLLPVHSEALSCERGTSVCSRNVIDFRNYKKFTADSSITFEPAPEK